MATLSTRERDRRGGRIVLAVLALIAAAVSVWLHFHTGTIRPSAFWVPTLVGLAYGSVVWPIGQRRGSGWWPNLVWVGFLGVFFVLLATKTFSAPAWFLAVLVGALLTEAVHPAKRAAPSAVAKLPLDQVRPWSGSGVTAAVTERPFGQPRARPAVLVTTQDGSTVFLVMDLAAFFDGETGIAESANGEQLTFLSRKGVAPRSSVLDDATPGLADGTLFFFTGRQDARPSAVFSNEDALAFEQWVRTIPED
ncbi:hypothetical protein [Curtobacterium sp. BRD11]|uniref:hypothetical protein n=1 Tax=Curtobacterium sp. BRD11 TaxID=2962581 RepID=UPI002880EBA7|nr:hypothetical protein [Curtobacterium sp. BRD11]MDT0208980.1 hypothetical protein [Curtobacterium sp. BRD11]